jgi:hypothetical protein
MKAAYTQRSYAVAILTFLGVLPVPADAAPPRSPLTGLNPVELEHATIVAAVEKTHDDIRAGRLGH